ncbi:MAG: hypothetical protein N2C14_03335, partial [Planctomycetales bacterium]
MLMIFSPEMLDVRRLGEEKTMQPQGNCPARFQFSLRAMFAALILSAVFLAALKEEWWSPAF